MIIKSLQAKNFMRYERLSLKDLPESGLIAVLGENESGKSTIGECIAFALFGQSIRTTSGNGDASIINWGADACEVTLEFAAEDGTIRRIVRQLDRAGARRAELFEGPQFRSVAKGTSEVGEKLESLIRFTFEEFRYSFYLGQGELGLLRDGNGADRRRVIHDMLGISDVEQARDDVRRILGEETAARDLLLAERSLIDKMTEALAADEEMLAKTQDTLANLREQERTCSEGIARLEQALAATRETMVAREGVLEAFASLRDRLVWSRHSERVACNTAELAGIRTALERARERLKTDYVARSRQKDELAARLEEARELCEKLERLEELVSLHGAAVKGDLGDGGRIEGKGRDYLLSDSEREKLAIVESRILRRTRRLKRRKIKMAAAALAGFVGVLASAALHLLIARRGFRFMGEPNPAHSAIIATFIGLAGLAFLGLTAWIAARIKAGVLRIACESETRQKLWDKIELLRRSLHAAERFDVNDPAIILAAMEDIRDESIRKLCRTMREQHPAFFKDGRRNDTEKLGREIDEATAELETIKNTAVHYKHIINVLDNKLPAIRTAGSVVDEANRDAEQRKIASPEHTEARVTELLEETAVSLNVVRSFAANPPGGPPDDGLVAEIAGGMERLSIAAGCDYDGKEARPAALKEYQERTTLARLVGDWRRMEVEPLERAIAEEAALLRQALPSEAHLRGREDQLSAGMAQERAVLAATRARQETLAESAAAFGPSALKRRSLQARREEIDRLNAKLEREAAVHAVLAELLEGTAAGMKRRLGPAVAQEIAAMLPKITGGRYDRVEIDDELTIRVYSPERGGMDYPLIHLADLSGGAADQILVALRLAISRAMLKAKEINNGCFLFFDEPVSSFDAERAGSFIELLKGFTPTFRQTFIVSHNEEIARQATSWADATIRTSLKTKKLTTTSLAPIA